jgi:hypothetical protein
MKNFKVLEALKEKFKNLEYNRQDYTMSIVTDDSPNKIPVFFMIFDSLHEHCRFEIIKSGDDYMIDFISDVDFDVVQDIFNIPLTQSLELDIKTAIHDIDNKLLFLNCFLFQNTKYTSDNNYNKYIRKKIIGTPNRLDPINAFVSEMHIGIYIRFFFDISNNKVVLSHRFLAYIGKDIYTYLSLQHMIDTFLIEFACQPLNINLNDIRLKDHIILQMTKV